MKDEELITGDDLEELPDDQIDDDASGGPLSFLDDKAPGYEREDRTPIRGKRTRKRELAVNAKDKTEEISERAMLIQLMGNDKRVSRILEIYDKSRHKEGQRSVDLQGSQRAFIYTMMAREEKQTALVTALLQSHVANNEQIGKLIIDKANASTVSKVAEVMEVVGAVAQLPIAVELQSMLLESLSAWRAKKKAEADADAARAIQEKNKKA